MLVRLKHGRGTLICRDVAGRRITLRPGETADLPLDDPALAALANEGAFESIIPPTDDRLADRIAGLLEAAPEGLSREAIRDGLQRNYRSERIKAALNLLKARGLACSEAIPTEGRPREAWRLSYAETENEQ